MSEESSLRIHLKSGIGIFFIFTVLVVGFASGYVYATSRVKAAMTATNSPTGVDMTPVWTAWDVINTKFVPAAVASSTPLATTTEALNQQKVWGMVSGLAESLNDPYTYFMPPSQSKQFSDDMSGSFGGVGMQIDVKKGVLTVVSPLKGTPADQAGIRAGDQILKIDGQSTQGMDTETAVQKIRGPKGSQVLLTIYREDWAEARDIKVTRQTINVPEVETKSLPGGVFVITVSTFTANSPDLFRNALREFVKSGDTHLVLDLRGNPGGYLDAAVNMASWFLPTGKVIVTEDYAGHSANVAHRSLGYDVFNKNLKMVVLVDKGSASASEILADALHYYGVAQLVGDNTFGKGCVQELVPITPDTSLKITVARWLGPDNIQIPSTGLTPDVKVSISDDDRKVSKDPQMDKAVEILKAK